MRSKAAVWLALLASTCLVPLGSSLAGELPAGPSVTHGSVGIATPGANTMTIQQSSAAAIVNWQSFSVGAGANVDIRQPSSSSALLNRVTGSTSSTIAGQINANGQVYLVNPNGIMITPSGAVRAGGGFVASTLGISDEDFKAGRRSFAGTGASAPVVNQGTIEVGRGGYAALLGGSVENTGTISVPLGRVGLGAGERATLDISGDGFLEVAMPSGSAGEKALIQHSGRIRANGGRVEMKAATAREVARQAINLTGVVEARTVGGRSGAIVLGGGAGGTVTVSGRLTASAPRQGRKAAATHNRPAAAGKGGEITITGDRIGLAGATIDASGRTGGGTIRIGGDLQGKGALPHARSTVVDSKTTITADATESGNGGSIVLWSDEFTGFGGLIRARGGATGGDGGSAEVSSKGVLSYTGQTVLTAAQGKFGTLLLDPYNIYIESGPTTNGSFTPSGDNSVINATDLQNALATANVTITTGGNSGTQAGNITVGAPITWTQATTLTLDADNNIVIAGAISAPQGGLTLFAGGTITTPLSWTTSTGSAIVGCSYSPCAPGSVNVGTFTLGSGAWTQTGPLYNNAAFSAADFRLSGGSFLRVLGGDGTTTPYQIADVYGLQGINTITNLSGGLDLTRNYVLANDIDASVTSGWTDGDGGIVGFTPLGGIATHSLPYAGTFNGQGHTVSSLFIDRPGETGVGLFGSVGPTATVTNLSLANVNISGNSEVGAIAGQNSGTISQVSASGTVAGVVFGTPSANNGATSIGGLIGANAGTLTRSYSTATVNGGPFGSTVGGLVGINQAGASIAQSYSAGAVSIGNGGLATSGGQRGGVIGGLVGENIGSISQTYSSATVTAGASTVLVGGLVGDNTILVTSDGTFTGTIAQSYATGAVSAGANSNSVGGLAGQNLGSVSQAYATGAVNGGAGSTAVGGLIGLNGATVAGSFWDLTTTGQAQGIGTDNTGSAAPTGLTTAQFQNPGIFVPLASAQGWSFEANWAPPSAGFYPELYTLSPVIRAVTDGTTRLYGGSSAFSLLASYGGPGSYVFGPSGDTLSLANPFASTATATSPVGSYSITGVNQTSTLGIAYRVVATQTDAALTPSITVAPAPLTVTANNQNKPYGLPFAFIGTEFSVSGLQNGETVGSAALFSAGALSTASTGLYAILIGSATGGSFNPSNYAIAYVPGVMSVGADPSLIDTPPAGNPTLDLPTTTVSLPNPPDNFDLTGGGGNGGSGGVGGGGPTLGTGRPGELDAARDTLASIERSSNDLESKVANCESQYERQKKAVNEYKTCVGGALEQFADALEAKALTLPGPMRGIPAAIRQAARKVRAARTIQEARAAVGAAVAEVRKAIALIRADDPAIGRLQLQQANRIASALGSVESRLSRATGL